MIRAYIQLKISTFHVAPPARSWRFTRSLEGTQTRQLTQTDQRDIPYHVVSYSAIKSLVKKEEGQGYWDAIYFPKKPLHGMSFHGNVCWWEVANQFLVLISLCVQLWLHLVNCLYLNPWDLILSPFWFFPSSRDWTSSCAVLSCLLGLSYSILSGASKK